MSALEINDKTQFEKAKLEDTLVQVLYSSYPDLVFHGGTAIWRCYLGNRFSRDIDFYLKGGLQDTGACYKKFVKFFKDSGFPVKSSNYDNGTKTMHFIVETNTKMKVDINLNYKKGKPTEYTKVDGSKIMVLALTPEKLLEEKIETYLFKLECNDGTRQPEAQDLYDIYHLTGKASNKNAKLRGDLKALLKKIEGRPPVNMNTLGNITLSGIAPSFELMIKSIEEWAV